jgi:hypothetical protein
MELCSLHPFDEAYVADFVRRLADGESSLANLRRGEPLGDAVRALESIRRGEERGTYELTHALGRELAARHPSFAHPGISLTSWEARVDRGAGMLMRPPSRLFIDGGLDPAPARRLPIRLELSRGMMGGAYIPARLVPDFERLLQARLERTLGRLIEAEWEGVAVLGLMIELAEYASQRGLAIYEAMDIVTGDGDVPGIPGATVLLANRKRLDKSLRQRLETAAKPPKKPGLLARLTGRGARPEIGTPS